MFDVFIGLIIGFGFGATWRESRDLGKKLTQMNKVEPISYGVTKGSYSSPKKTVNKKSSSVVNPKSPEQLEYEKAERELRLDNANESVKNIIERAHHNVGN